MEPPDTLPLASRLLGIHEGLARVLGDFQPAECAVEQTFVNKDGVATLKLGQARGVAMLAPAMFGIPVAEYAPNQVKKTVVGAGHADKSQILVMLKILLPKAEPPSADAADEPPITKAALTPATAAILSSFFFMANLLSGFWMPTPHGSTPSA